MAISFQLPTTLLTPTPTQNIRKICTHLDLLSILQSECKISKRLGGMIGYKDKLHLKGFPDGSNIGLLLLLLLNESAIDLSNTNPDRGHKEVRRSTGHIMVTTRYSNQHGSKSRQNPCQVQPPKDIGNISAPRLYLWVLPLSIQKRFSVRVRFREEFDLSS